MRYPAKKKRLSGQPKQSADRKRILDELTSKKKKKDGMCVCASF